MIGHQTRGQKLNTEALAWFMGKTHIFMTGVMRKKGWD